MTLGDTTERITASRSQSNNSADHGFDCAGEAQPCYGAVPMRAASDRRLWGAPMALLVIIAGHYRFGRNGHGCYASQRRLAELMNCRQATVQEALGILEAAGIVDVEIDANDRRRRVYRVIYTEEDWRAFNPKNGRGSQLARDHTFDTPERIKSKSKRRPKNDAGQRINSTPIDTVRRIEKRPKKQRNTNEIKRLYRGEGSLIYSAKQEDITQKQGSPRSKFGAGAGQTTTRRSEGERIKPGKVTSDPRHIANLLNESLNGWGKSLGFTVAA